jgi:hypothetical protein
VARNDRVVQIESADKRRQVGRHRGARIVILGGVGLAVATGIGCNHVKAAGKGDGDAPPTGAAVRRAVRENKRGQRSARAHKVDA